MYFLLTDGQENKRFYGKINMEKAGLCKETFLAITLHRLPMLTLTKKFQEGFSKTCCGHKCVYCGDTDPHFMDQAV